MRVLLTGATGFVGLNIVEALLHAGHHVTAYVRPQARRRYLDTFPVRVVEGMLQDPRALRVALEDAEAVIHTAGNTSTDWRDWSELEGVNVQGTRAVLEAVMAAGGRRLVYTSSTATLDGHSGKGELESRPVSRFRSNSPYARTKAAAEALLLERPECIVLNPAEVIGPYDHTLQWGRMVLAVALGKVPFTPPGGGSFCPARDVAQAHVAALTKGEPGRRYILAGHNVPFSRFLELIKQETGGSTEPACKLPYRLQVLLAQVKEMRRARGGPGPAVDSFRMRVFSSHHYFDDTMARQELGYAPRPLETAIAECYRWYHEQGFLPNPATTERPTHA